MTLRPMRTRYGESNQVSETVLPMLGQGRGIRFFNTVNDSLTQTCVDTMLFECPFVSLFCNFGRVSAFRKWP